MYRSKARGNSVRSFSRPVVAAGMTMVPTAIGKNDTGVRQHGTHPWRSLYSQPRGKWIYPSRGHDPISSDYMKQKTFYTKPRDQWDYNRVDEQVTKQSEFGKMEGRDMFFGSRDYDNNTFHDKCYMKHPRDVKMLWEYFDQYTQPGSDPKTEAARAVQEHWDAENFYYPGESWKRNRPGFRSVPKEILNKETWYSDIHILRNYEKVHTQGRPRAWVPRWPPPGFRQPKYPARKDLCIGVEHPELAHELERFHWYKMWLAANSRIGFGEALWCIGFMWIIYFGGRVISCEFVQWQKVFSCSWYPGKSMVRSFGEAKDAEEGHWWSRPLDDTTWFKEPGLAWVLSEWRFGMIQYEIKQAELRAIHGEDIPKEENQVLGGGGHFPYFVRSPNTGPVYSMCF